MPSMVGWIGAVGSDTGWTTLRVIGSCSQVGTSRPDNR